MTFFSKGRRVAGLLVPVAVLAVTALGVTVAHAARGNWVHSVAPKTRHHYDVGDRVHFKVRARGVDKGIHVFAAVTTSRKTKRGVLKPTRLGDFFQFAKRRHHRYTHTSPNSTYMQQPGTYYWQAQFADTSCPNVLCLSKIRSFKVR